MLSRLPAGALAGSAAALAALAARAATTGGAATGAILSMIVWSAAGWRGFVLLGAFVALASGATRWRAARRDGSAGGRGDEGPRDSRQAVANMGAAALLSLLAIMGRLEPGAVLAAFTAALAAALSDTMSTEAGQAMGGRPVLITTWRPVPAGTDGGISPSGTLAGLASSSLLALLAWGVGSLPLSGVPVVAFSGFAGNLVDSLLGATLERRGILENDSVNFLATVAGALCAFVLWSLLF